MTVYKTVDLELVDNQGGKTRMSVVLQSDVTTIAGIQSALDDYIADLANVSDAGILAASATIPLSLTATAPGDAANKDENAWVSIVLTDGRNPSIRLPMPKRTAGVFDFISGGAVDKTNSDLVGWFENYLAAGEFAYGKYTSTPAAIGGLNGGYLERK